MSFIGGRGVCQSSLHGRNHFSAALGLKIINKLLGAFQITFGSRNRATEHIGHRVVKADDIKQVVGLQLR